MCVTCLCLVECECIYNSNIPQKFHPLKVLTFSLALPLSWPFSTDTHSQDLHPTELDSYSIPVNLFFFLFFLPLFLFLSPLLCTSRTLVHSRAELAKYSGRKQEKATHWFTSLSLYFSTESNGNCDATHAAHFYCPVVLARHWGLYATREADWNVLRQD